MYTQRTTLSYSLQVHAVPGALACMTTNKIITCNTPSSQFLFLFLSRYLFVLDHHSTISGQLYSYPP